MIIQGSKGLNFGGFKFGYFSVRLIPSTNLLSYLYFRFQYKFLVDGVWRLDDQQPFVTDEHGIANNIILVREPELVPSILRSEASSSNSSMDVDNGIFRHLVSY